MLQIIITLAIYLILVIPMGNYLYKIAMNQKTVFDPLFNPLDKSIYTICSINPQKGMNWKQYVMALIITNAVMMFAGYIILRLQNLLFFNPNHIGAMEASLSFNTIISFMTNTNLQHYSGENGLSYLSQMCVITFMMFTSAASGYAACVAFVRGITGCTSHQTADDKNMGNFFVDLTRIITRILLPISFIIGLLLVWQGVPQTLHATITVETLEGTLQDIAMGPIAALEAIKHLGTNGGGFIGANSSSPIENPTIITNMLELYAMMLLPGACIIMFGKMVKNNIDTSISLNRFFGNEGKPIFIAMSIIFMLGLCLCYYAEIAGNPKIAEIGISQNMGNMEGKETRFGISQSTLFTTATTSFTTGSVNNMHDTLTPLGGMVPLLHMMLNLVFGGKGVGLMNMTMYIILTVFICGLMIGRTPEYLGKKIEGREMKLTALCIIIHPLLILSFSALAVTTEAGLAGLSNPNFHGLSQVLYEYASSAANNGSGFEGLADNTLFWNITTGLAMFFGRYLTIILQLAIAASLLKKISVPKTIGTLQTESTTFTFSLVLIVYIFTALTFFPVLALGPIAEHLILWK